MSETEIPTFPKDAVRVVRDAYKENQEQFAKRIGVQRTAIARWENPNDHNSPSGPAAILLQQLAKRKKVEVTS